MPSDLQITNIKDQANANSAITIGSDGQITVNQNNPTITLGSNTTFPLEHYRWTTGFSNSWQNFNWTVTTSVEDGIRIRRMGPLYIVDMSISKTGMTQGAMHTEKVLELGSNITHPTNSVLLGLNSYGGSTQEYYFHPYIDSNGDLYVRGYNSANTTFDVHGSFIGLDVA